MTDEQELRKRFCNCGKILFDRGLAAGSAGNMSMRLGDGNFIVTPTGSSLGSLNPDSLSKIDANGNLLSGNKPTKEVKFHLAIFSKNPWMNAIIHLHSSYATAYACLDNLNPQDALRPMTPYQVMKLGKILVSPYRKPGSPLIAEDLLKIAAGHKTFLLANHGMVTGGKDLADALNCAQELEDDCKLYFITAGCNIRYLTPDEIAELEK